MKLILLRGLDGTGLLFKPLLKVLPDFYEPEVISYSATLKQTYSELVEQVKTQLPTEPFLLLASFFTSPFPKLGLLIWYLSLFYLCRYLNL